MNQKHRIQLRPPLRHRRCRAFTLVEVAASTLLLGILLSVVVVAFNRSVDSITDNRLRAAASSVAQRRIETVMATMQEPNDHELHGRDELDPRFLWTLKLTREPVQGYGDSQDLETSVIRAQVNVQAADDSSGGGPLLELTRYFSTLEPLEGETVAVPFQSEQPQVEEPWIDELRDTLGREPTLDELLQEMIKRGEISPEMGEGLDLPSLPELPQDNGT